MLRVKRHTRKLNIFPGLIGSDLAKTGGNRGGGEGARARDMFATITTPAGNLLEMGDQNQKVMTGTTETGNTLGCSAGLVIGYTYLQPCQLHLGDLQVGHNIKPRYLATHLAGHPGKLL